MKKFFLVLVSIILITAGIYGTYFVFTFKRADKELGMAIADINDGRYEEAVETLKSVIAGYSRPSIFSPALYLLADTYERSGKYKNALDTHKVLLSSSRINNLNNWRMMSLIAVSTMYRNGLIPLGDTRDTVLDNYIGVIKQKIDQRKKQAGTYASVITDRAERMLYSFLDRNSRLRIMQNDDEAITGALETELGFLYLSRERYEEAEKILNRQRTKKARLGMALLYFETGRYREGEVLLQELLAYDSSGRLFSFYVQELFRTAENLFKNRNYEEALNLYRKITRLTKNNRYEEISLYRLSNYAFKHKRYTESLEYINRVLTNGVPDKDEESLLLKGYIYYDRRKYVEALRIFNDFLKRYPHSSRAGTAREWKAMCERSIRYLN